MEGASLTLDLQLGALRPRADARLADWQRGRFGARLWAKDPTLWSSEPVPEITDRLGWLDLPSAMGGDMGDLTAFASRVRSDGIHKVVLLGMGGSSLAPEVFARVFGAAEGFPELSVLDSTHPGAVLREAAGLDPGRTLFVVSSKSGTTLETLSLFRFFWVLAGAKTPHAGHHFVAITDPGTPLLALGQERGFRRVFLANPDVGGRYSALSHFGLVPAALLGVDLKELRTGTEAISRACSAEVSADSNPGLALGAALAEAALAGRDKVTFFGSPSLAAIPVWLEQLIAESTGKAGLGIVPVADEPPRHPSAYGPDRFFVRISLRGDKEDPEGDAFFGDLEAAGHPTARVRLGGKDDLGGLFLLWEVAVASAGAALGIHPFNQPDVQLAKELAKQAMAQGSEALPTTDDSVSARGPHMAKAALEWLSTSKAGDYVCVQAYLAPGTQIWDAVQSLRGALGRRLGIATTAGYGPRFLHSTGQLHKGGPNTGLFLQIVDDPQEDVRVPEADFSFGALIRAQAMGDYRALLQRGRRVLKVDVGSDALAGLQRLCAAIEG